MSRKFFLVQNQGDLNSALKYAYPTMQPMSRKFITSNPLAFGSPIYPSPIVPSPLLIRPTLFNYGINKNVNVSIKIISTQFQMSITVPYDILREVIDALFVIPPNTSETDKIDFRVIAPGINSTLRTSIAGLLDSTKKINDKYKNKIRFQNSSTNRRDLYDLLASVLDKLENRGYRDL